MKNKLNNLLIILLIGWPIIISALISPQETLLYIGLLVGVGLIFSLLNR